MDPALFETAQTPPSGIRVDWPTRLPPSAIIRRSPQLALGTKGVSPATVQSPIIFRPFSDTNQRSSLMAPSDLTAAVCVGLGGPIDSRIG